MLAQVALFDGVQAASKPEDEHIVIDDERDEHIDSQCKPDFSALSAVKYPLPAKRRRLRLLSMRSY